MDNGKVMELIAHDLSAIRRWAIQTEHQARAMNSYDVPTEEMVKFYRIVRSVRMSIPERG